MLEVKDHYHLIGRTGGAAYSKCNLMYSKSK